jgi:hypothetical protein
LDGSLRSNKVQRNTKFICYLFILYYVFFNLSQLRDFETPAPQPTGPIFHRCNCRQRATRINILSRLQSRLCCFQVICRDCVSASPQRPHVRTRLQSRQSPPHRPPARRRQGQIPSRTVRPRRQPPPRHLQTARSALRQDPG